MLNNLSDKKLSATAGLMTGLLQEFNALCTNQVLRSFFDCVSCYIIFLLIFAGFGTMNTRDRNRFVSIVTELEANAWLEKELLGRMEAYEQSLPEQLEAGEYKASIGILTNRLPRPVLKHLYLLSFYPLTDEQLEEKVSASGYKSFEAVRYHYHRNNEEAERAVRGKREFPQAFLEMFLVSTMAGDISKGSAHRLLTLFANLGLVERKVCVTGNNSLTVFFGDAFRSVVEEWLDRRDGVFQEEQTDEAA